MNITNLKLQNYRNYNNLEIDFDKNLNIIIGNNAAGKTNILESIYVLAITKSHITKKDKSMIKLGEIFANITGNINYKDSKKKLSINLNEEGKIVKINNKEIKRISEYISKLNIIIFSPDDLKLIKDNASYRRRFLNIEISQINKNYLKEVNDYNNLLKNRNNILKKMKENNYSDEIYLDVLNNKLSELCASIYLKRKDYIDKINKKISSIYNYLTGNNSLKLKYLTNFTEETENYEEIKNNFLKKLQKNLNKEIMYGMTLYGIHRDDFLFCLNDKSLIMYGSQGQQRCSVLSLKLSEVEIFREITKEAPILLLDDIFSEIDNNKKNKLLTYINNDIQTIITTTDLNKIQKKIKDVAKIFVIEDGNIKKTIQEGND